jgi:hypothetical protein
MPGLHTLPAERRVTLPRALIFAQEKSATLQLWIPAHGVCSRLTPEELQERINSLVQFFDPGFELCIRQ